MSKRQRQLDIGKATAGYQNYVAAVSRCVLLVGGCGTVAVAVQYLLRGGGWLCGAWLADGKRLTAWSPPQVQTPVTPQRTPGDPTEGDGMQQALLGWPGEEVEAPAALVG